MVWKFIEIVYSLYGEHMNYYKIYYSIIESRKHNKYDGYTECHHILPRCLGGTNDKSNLVRLTAKEHFICHLLLTKMYAKGSSEYAKMCHAFLMMTVSSKNQNRYITAKKYEVLRKEYKKRISYLQSGERHNQYGSIWIFNPILEENKKIKNTDIIEDGWIKGRIVDWGLYRRLQQKKIEKEKIKLQRILDKNRVSKHYLKKIELDNIDWDMLYSLYTAYGFDIASHLTGWTKSRESMLMQFKNRVTNYAPSQKMKKIWDENYSKG